MRVRTLLLGAAIGLLSVSCASMNKAECASADWKGIGHTDGKKGLSNEKYIDRKDACSEHGYAVDKQSYAAGYKIGLKQYCTAVGGLEAGRAGESYHNVCKGSDEKTFLKAYSQAKAYHDANADVETAQLQLDTAENDLEDHKLEIASLSARIGSATAEQQAKYQKKISKLTKEAKRLNRDKRLYASNLRTAEKDLRNIEASFLPFEAKILEAAK